MISLVVFSKDRAMQLDSLLRSVKDHCTGIDEIHVIAKASSLVHLDAYSKLVDNLPSVPLVAFTVNGEGGGLPLGEDVAQVCEDTDHIALAVDDMLFYRPSDFNQAIFELEYHLGFVWSWRLGDRVGTTARWCLNTPRGIAHWLGPALTSDPDYGYLFHTDGAFYRTENYTKMLDTYLPDWKTGAYTPNDLEAAVAARRSKWAPMAGPHLGPLEPTCITWQLNRVQTKYGSPAAEIPETNIDALAKAYLEGRRVDNEKLYAALQANPVQWNPPGTRPTHVYACEEASKFWASCVR